MRPETAESRPPHAPPPDTAPPSCEPSPTTLAYSLLRRRVDGLDATVTIATDKEHVDNLAVDATHVYWSGYFSYRAPKQSSLARRGFAVPGACPRFSARCARRQDVLDVGGAAVEAVAANGVVLSAERAAARRVACAVDAIASRLGELRVARRADLVSGAANETSPGSPVGRRARADPLWTLACSRFHDMRQRSTLCSPTSHESSL